MAKDNNKINKKFSGQSTKNIEGWQAVVEAAERLLLRIQIRESEVRAIVRLFKEKMEAGEPCPGDLESAWPDKAGTDEDSIPA